MRLTSSPTPSEATAKDSSCLIRDVKLSLNTSNDAIPMSAAHVKTPTAPIEPHPLDNGRKIAQRAVLLGVQYKLRDHVQTESNKAADR
jgi:hypothetical protein